MSKMNSSMTNIIRGVILFLLLPGYGLQPVYGTQVIIQGHAPEYGGDTLKFFTYGDLISFRETPLISIPVMQDGRFQGKCDLQETKEIFAPLGVYHAYFFGEPGHQYTLALPPKKEKEIKDVLNPYFKPVPVHIGILEENKEELNVLIDRFDRMYNPFFNARAKNIYVNKRNDNLTLFTDSVRKIFAGTDNVFFLHYLNARLLTLKVMKLTDRVAAQETMIGFTKEIMYFNPAFMDIFNQLFSSYLKFLLKGDLTRDINRAVMIANSPDSLRTIIGESLHTTDQQLTDLVLIKGLYDAVYNNTYPRKKLISLLQKTGEKNPFPYHKKIVYNLLYNIHFLEPGSYPPPFRIPDIFGKMKTLSDFRGKYVYLNFSNRLSYSSLRQFPLLQQLHQKYKDQLMIITITPENDPETLKHLLASHQYSWTFLLSPPSGSVIWDYKIKVFPTYILLGPDGKVLLAPAPSPTENFESVFQQIMKKSELK